MESWHPSTSLLWQGLRQCKKKKVLGQLPTKDNSQPDKNNAHPLPTGTTIPRTIPHQDNSPLGPLPQNKTTHQDQNMYCGELSWWGVVRIRRKKKINIWIQTHSFPAAKLILYFSLHTSLNLRTSTDLGSSIQKKNPPCAIIGMSKPEKIWMN